MNNVIYFNNQNNKLKEIITTEQQINEIKKRQKITDYYEFKAALIWIIPMPVFNIFLGICFIYGKIYGKINNFTICPWWACLFPIILSIGLLVGSNIYFWRKFSDI